LAWGLGLDKGSLCNGFYFYSTVKPITIGSFVATGIILALITEREVTGFIVFGIIGAFVGWIIQGGILPYALKILVPLLLPLLTLYILIMKKWRFY
jgi:uncharacterized membrane protein YfcA